MGYKPARFVGFPEGGCQSGRRILCDGNRVSASHGRPCTSQGVVARGGTAVSRSSLGLLGTAGRTTCSRMPVVRARLGGRCFQCLVDTGSERTVVCPRVVAGQSPRKRHPLVMADGSTSCEGQDCRVVISLQGHCFRVNALVMPNLENLGVDCLLGIDVINHLGGVTVSRDASLKYVVRWGKPQADGCCRILSNEHPGARLACSVGEKSGVAKASGATAPLVISDPDFDATFADGRWVVRWRWSGDAPLRLQTRIAEYKCTRAPQVRERYDAEIQSWISKGWLREWHGPVEGIIPLLAVVQPTKDKVRPVMDYRELNHFVECHTGDDMVAVCGDKIRKWRQLQGELGVVDLKSAYLQIHISEDLWRYQVVKYEGKPYALTRLGFGLSCAPRIMTAILGKVLSLDDRVRRGTDHYIDDIVVQKSVVGVEELRKHLAKYGLETKEPESLDGGRLLGISLNRDHNGHLRMSRVTALSEVGPVKAGLTKRELFSLCGRLVGHYPVAGWLRPCCSFLKRLGCRGSWDAPVDSRVGHVASELLQRAYREDPVKGVWHVKPGGTATVWTDASCLAMGVALEVDGEVVEDATWLRKESDYLHINVAELEAVARGINLAIVWKFKTFTIATDSRTVVSWMENTIDGRSRVRTKGAAEMLVKRRLGVIRDTIAEHGLTVSVRFVSTIENRADQMTRVPKKWLSYRDTGEAAEVSAALATGESPGDAIWAAHLPHHLGVDRTFYLAKQIRNDLSRDQVKREIAGCDACQRIDPATQAENLVAKGSLAVEENWRRVAVDVTHYGANLFLSMVDCGPSRFAIWRRLSNETAACIVAQLTSSRD